MMGIDPTTHEPLSNCGLMFNRTTTLLSSSPSTRHMAQWESARLEAEARLSKESLLSIPSSLGKSEDDFYLRLWNSEVGEEFRKFKKDDKISDQSPISTKCCSLSGTTTEVGPESNKSWTELIRGGTDSCSSSNEVEDSSDESTLQLLLDYPSSNDMSFLENDCYNTFYRGFLH
ncbi:hypothetical protein ACS0TY_019888 [Phlomoides rotata]